MRFLTAGESHGPALTLILEGLPAGFALSVEKINQQLMRRQQGYGRGPRMKIEQDRVEITAGLRSGLTLGSPISLLIKNQDFANWEQTMHPVKPRTTEKQLLQPRPGHADLAGGIKYGATDLRDIAERASARETAARVAAGAVALQMLAALGVVVESRVIGIGTVELSPTYAWETNAAEQSQVRCPDLAISQEMMRAIDQAAAEGDSLGGRFQVRVSNLPAGIGSVMHWDKRLDGLLGQALLSIPAIKAVEIGDAIGQSRSKGTQAQDELSISDGNIEFLSNRAGGIEGGMTNGQPLLLTGFMKPIPSIVRPLKSFHWLTREPAKAARERADACAVPAASIVGESVTALVLLQVLLDQLGGDQWEQFAERYKSLKRS